MSEATVRLLEQRRDAAIADLRALDAQVTADEIGEDDARRLRRRYEADVADALAALDEASAAKPAGRSKARVWTGVTIFGVAATVAVLALAGAVQTPDDTAAGSGVAADVISDGGVDLSSISDEDFEAAVASNPDITPMRLALARRYVEASNFSSALPHYLYILEQGPDPEALMYVGWMTYLSGDPATGATLLERSLEVMPDNVLATWFLANVHYHGLGDMESAIPLLEQVIGSGLAPPDIVEEAQSMIDDAGAGS